MLNKSHIVILGAGAAGIGMAVTLKRLGLQDVIVVDKGRVGESFHQWNQETRFITPSFNTQGFGFVDLNAVTPNTSPGYYSQTEHLSGKAYANYLQELVDYFGVDVRTHQQIIAIHPLPNKGFRLISDTTSYETDYLIVATGDWSYPNRSMIEGNELATFYTELNSLITTLTPKAHPLAIIGGNESGFDAAIQLARKGQASIIYTQESGLDSTNSDPSQALSLYTKDRYRAFKDLIRVQSGVRIIKIDQKYLYDESGATYPNSEYTILATGFSAKDNALLAPLFEYPTLRPRLTAYDESTKQPNTFLVGPQVEHGNTIFCYIYKFRQRFAVIAQEIARRSGLPIDTNELKYFKDNQFILEDLSCCQTDCLC